jgi:Spy/CpxP family protein refolding chaperone
MTRRPKRIATLYLAAVFGAGAVFGMAAYRFYAVNSEQADFRTAPLSPQEYRARMVSKLQQELGLSSEQTVELQRIYDYIGERWHDVRDAMEPEFEAMRQERAERILGILTPEQQEKYRAILEEKRRKRAAAQASGSCY